MNKTNTMKMLNAIRHKYDNGEYVSNEDFKILMEHFKYHPDWDTTKCPPPRKVIAIMVKRRNPSERNTCFNLVLDDGTMNDIGIPSVVDGEFGKRAGSKSRLLSKVQIACRSAIKPMIASMRQKIMDLVREHGGEVALVSKLTGRPFVVRGLCDFHIDHYDKTFGELCDEWILNHPQIQTSPGDFIVDSDSDATTHGVRFSNVELERDFIDFHNANTHLRILPPCENLSVSKQTRKTR